MPVSLKRLLAPLLVAAIATAAPLATLHAASAYTPPPVEAGDDGWETYVDPLLFDTATAAGVSPAPETPEAAVVLFLASRIRGDTAWQDALTAEPGRKLQRAIDEWSGWTLVKARLEARKMKGDDRYYVRVWFEIGIDGDTDEGSDEFTVIRENDGWRITGIPS